MEVVGGISSVGTLLGGTITTLKFFYNSVQHIRQASDTVEYLSSAVHDFLLLLERLDQIARRVNEETSVDCEALEILLIKCNKNFKKWQEEVDNLQDKGNGSQHRASRLLWKGRVGLKTQRLRDILATLNGDKITLNSHLSCIESDLSCFRNRAIERQPEMITATLLESQYTTYQHLNTQQVAQQESLAQFHSSLQAGQSLVLKGLEEISKRLNKQPIEERKASGIDTVINDFISVNGISDDGIISELCSDFTHGKKSANVESVWDPEVEYQKISGDSFTEAIKRLGTLASRRSKIVFRAIDDEDSMQSIIEDLGQILELASYELGLRQRIQYPRLRRKIREDYLNSAIEWEMPPKSITLARDMKRMMGMLNSAHSLAIDDQAKSRVSKASPKQFTLRNNCYNIDTAYGKFVLKLTLHQAKGKEKANETLPKEHDTLLEIYSASISLIPNDSNAPYKIAASFVQRSTFEGSLSQTPRISFSAIIPYGSEVFRRIRLGDLKGLIELFDGKVASLTDCDPEGRSLLGYACDKSRPAICRFLVDQGADVDSFEHDFSDISLSHQPLLLQVVGNSGKLKDQCRRVLLEAGADPTLEADFFGELNSSPLKQAMRIGNFPSFKDILDCSIDFIDLEELDDDGATLLMRSLHGCDVAVAKSLIHRGANVMSRDDNGFTILHHMARNFRHLNTYPTLGQISTKNHQAYIDFICFLIKQGVDIDALTIDGDTISNLVYRNNIYPYEAWEEALAKCGYDIFETLVKHLHLCGWRPSMELRFLGKITWPTTEIRIIRKLLKYSTSHYRKLESRRGFESRRGGVVWHDLIDGIQETP